MSAPRFHVPAAASLAQVELPDEAAHHAAHVLRLRVGSDVRVFDGAGHEFEARVESLGRNRVSVAVGAAVSPRPESPLNLILALAPLKGDRMDFVIQKATELGVTALMPVITARTDAAGRPAASGARDERWRRIAAGAAEQCGRAVVPAISTFASLPGFLASPLPECRIVLLETAGHPALRSTAGAAAIVALVGPAGGLAPEEVTAITAAGFLPRSLGARVLRAETAAIAAVTLLQALHGDLG